MSRFIGLTLIPVAVILLVLWCAAGTANASELEPGLHTFESDCHSQPLANGRPGETVRVCEHVKLVRITASKAKPATRRPGVTTVVNYGHRTPVYSIAYL